MCGKSKYNPDTGEYDDYKLFCGLAPPSWDTRVESLPDCPKNMTISALRTHQKKLIKNQPWRLRDPKN